MTGGLISLRYLRAARTCSISVLASFSGRHFCCLRRKSKSLPSTYSSTVQKLQGRGGREGGEREEGEREEGRGREGEGEGEREGGWRRGEEGGEMHEGLQAVQKRANIPRDQGTHEFLSISNTSYNRTTFGCSSFLWMLYSRRACLVVRRTSEST